MTEHRLIEGIGTGTLRQSPACEHWCKHQPDRMSKSRALCYTSQNDLDLLPDHCLKVDFPSSAEMHRTVVNAGVDAELDTMKRTYDGIEDLLNKTSRTIAADVPPEYSLDLNVIFFPQIGFLISMPINPHTGRVNYEGGAVEDRQWDRIFSTGSRVYYKDFRMRELDETLGDMYAIICGMPVALCR